LLGLGWAGWGEGGMGREEGWRSCMGGYEAGEYVRGGARSMRTCALTHPTPPPASPASYTQQASGGRVRDVSV